MSYEQNTWLAGILSDTAGGILSPRPKTCQCLPSPLLHNSHSDWSRELRRRENICLTSKRGHALSSANTASIHTWQTAALVLGWLNWRGRCREKKMWCEEGWDDGWKLAETKTIKVISIKIGCDATKWMDRAWCAKVWGKKGRVWRKRGE